MKEHFDPFKKTSSKEKDPFLKREEKESLKAEREVEEKQGQEQLLEEEQKKVFENIQREENHSSQNNSYHSSYFIPKKEAISAFVAAGFWIRFVAYIIDIIVAAGFASIFASPIIALMGWPQGILPGLIKGFFYLLYFILSTKFTNGQTLGKMITGIRTIHPKEENLSWTTVILREGCCRLIQRTIPLLYLIVPFTPRKQSIADMLCDTYVVKEELYAMEKRKPHIFREALQELS
ncbi:RDD family protein [Peptoniphilus sp. KCTC 25270]|uniref:RDD family protein n=1 Tax=Peptoniphilus sp. KCTC 25270 TaxID=2897414 RepID=UPI001E3ECB3A|nr:RDD family protein [Peptoniphilus sp. KCTC 25270]MCD1147426.1 RDD family protein [Peptoniphilus sp. KCTC 25270]